MRFSVLPLLWLAALPYGDVAPVQAAAATVSKGRNEGAVAAANTVRRLPTSAGAVRAALADLHTKVKRKMPDGTVKEVYAWPKENWPFTRYVWVGSDPTDFKILSLAVNYVSGGTVIRRPVVLAKAGLARIDVRWYAPADRNDGHDLSEWIQAWEQLQFDPAFSFLITGDTVRFLTKDNWPRRKVKKLREVKTAPYREGGQWYNTRWITDVVEERIDPKDITLIRQNAVPELEQLQNELLTQAPIVSYPYFLARALSTIKDRGLFATVYGGLYYDFAGIGKSKDAKRQTDFDLFFQGLGLGDGTKGSFRKILDGLRSGSASVVFARRLNGKPGRQLWVNTPATRPNETAGIVFVTEDIRDQDVDTGQHAVMNVLGAKVAAYEVIALQLNGLQRYALFDGNGKRLDEAAPDVAVDSTVPTGHQPRLQAAIGCIRCHGPQDGWQPLANDLQTLLAGYRKLDILGDVSNAAGTIPDVVDRIAGLYSGDPDKPLDRARVDYAAAVLRATGPWLARRAAGPVEPHHAPPLTFPAGKAQERIVPHASERIAAVWQGQRYGKVDAAVALLLLGFKAPAGRELETLRLLLPPARTGLYPTPEDPRIAALLAGMRVNRTDFDFTRAFMARRTEKRWRELTTGLSVWRKHAETSQDAAQ